MSDDKGLAREAQRQQALLAALAERSATLADWALHESPARAERGLAAYRANALALAERALGAACPTLLAMLGKQNFRHLARDFWRAHPPQRGDIGEWGGELPDWLATQDGLSDWPWLADCARLDLAVHHGERAADADFDATSLALLQTDDPAQLRLVLMPGTTLLRSRWPLARIHAAHVTQDEGHDDAAFDALRQALAEGCGETVLVARSGWRAQVHPIDDAGADFVEALLAGANLGAALERAGEGFDFAAWFARALGASWLKGVDRWHD